MSHCCCGGKGNESARKQNTENGPQESIVLNVKGMTCNHCVMSIKNGLGEIDGVNDIDVNLAEGKVTVKYDPVVTNVDVIKQTVPYLLLAIKHNIGSPRWV